MKVFAFQEYIETSLLTGGVNYGDYINISLQSGWTPLGWKTSFLGIIEFGRTTLSNGVKLEATPEGLTITDAYGGKHYVGATETFKITESGKFIDPGCFPASTPIQIGPAEAKAISDIRVGDVVLAFDPDAGFGRGALVPRHLANAVISNFYETAGRYVTVLDKEAGAVLRATGMTVAVLLEGTEVYTAYRNEGLEAATVQTLGAVGGFAGGVAAAAGVELLYEGAANWATLSAAYGMGSYLEERFSESAAQLGLDGLRAAAAVSAKSQINQALAGADAAMGQYYFEQTGISFAGHCFSAGTPVGSASGIDLPIERVSVGDHVRSFAGHSSEIASGRVKRLFRGVTDAWLELYLEPRAAPILTVTPGHRFLDDRGNFTTISDMLEHGGGRARVVLEDGSLAEVEGRRIVYSEETAHLYEQAEDIRYRYEGGLALTQFDVPTSSLRNVGTGVGKIFGPNSIFGPRLGITEMPPATNIIVP